jgi:predicted phage terminase large subunit-like protein
MSMSSPPLPEFIRTRPSKQRAFLEVVKNPRTLGKAEKCRRTFPEFIREFWDCVSQDELKWNWHIGYLAQELSMLVERAANGLPKKYDLVINVPPGTTKSITCSIMLPDWAWTRWPWLRFICTSYSSDLSLELAEYSRELIRSDKFRQLYPHIGIKEDKDTKSNFRIVVRGADGKTRIGGNRFSTSVGGTVTGFHAHVIIIDDPLNPRQAVSEVGLRNANHYIDHTLSTRKVDKSVTPVVLIMQRLHQDDPAGHMIEKNPEGVKHICLPGEIVNFRDQVRPLERILDYSPDGLMDPVRMPWSVLREMESNGQYFYAGQVGQHPTPPGGGMFQVDHFQIVDKIPSGGLLQTIRYWDKAGTEGGGAFTAGVKMCRLSNGRYVVLDVKRGQWSSDHREEIIKQTAIADGKKVRIYVEQEPGSGGKESAEATIRNLAGFAVYADRPTGDKTYRADPFSVQVNAGNVYLLRADWNKAWKDEYGYYPFSTHKDQVDAGSGGFNKLAAKKIARVL